MSHEFENVTTNENPISQPESTKSNSKYWIFGAVGCFGLIFLVCCGIGLGVYLVIYKPFTDFQTENVTLATESPEVQLVTGTPAVVKQPMNIATKGPQEIELSGEISGPDGSATLVIGAKVNGVTWERDYIFIRTEDDQEINLDPEAMFELDISDEE
ncbi:MAG: hypothetical protein AAF623_14235 [Planctomycetota bacterium]